MSGSVHRVGSMNGSVLRVGPMNCSVTRRNGCIVRTKSQPWSWGRGIFILRGRSDYEVRHRRVTHVYNILVLRYQIVRIITVGQVWRRYPSEVHLQKTIAAKLLRFSFARLRRWFEGVLTISLSYRLAIRSFSVVSGHKGLVELLSQLGSIVSEPIHSWDSSKHHVVVVEFVPELLVAEVEELLPAELETEEFQPAELEIEEFQPAELELEVLYSELEFEESELELHSRQRFENSIEKEDCRPENLPRLQARNVETIIIPS